MTITSWTPLYTFPQVNYTTHNNNNNTQGSLDFNIKNNSLMASTGDSYDPQKPHFNQGMLQNSGFLPTLGSQENPINIGGRSNQTTPYDNQRSLWSKFDWSNLADHMVGDLRHLPQALNTGNPGFSGDYQDSFLVGNENNSMDFDGKLGFSTDIDAFCAKEPDLL